MISSRPNTEDPKRFLLYSHDSFGLGHLRRSLTLAEALTEKFKTASVLIASGSPCATHFGLPERCDIVKLPSVSKGPLGAYASPKFDLPVTELIDLRRELLLTTFHSWRPDVFVVDHRVTGLMDEVLPVLHAAGKRGTKRVLGMRDIVDEPEAVAREWDNEAAVWALDEGYDEILVYGDQGVFDPRMEYPLSSRAADKITFTGYLTRQRGDLRRRALPRPRAEVLVTLGGGGDGASRAESILDGIDCAPTPWETSIVLGPVMDPETARRIERRARAMRNVHITRFEPDLVARMSDADLVVGMAGYNTTAELLASGRPALLLPRCAPRREQEIRASRLAARGAARFLTAPSPLELRAAIAAALETPTSPKNAPDLEGAAFAAARIGRLAGLHTAPLALTN